VCLAVPMRVAALLGDGLAEVEVGEVRVRASLAMIENVAVGDYVIVHAGFAINRLDIAEAEKSLALFAEIAERLGEPTDALRLRIS
jgi:hydrogenase expression/formation protein HypC